MGEDVAQRGRAAGCAQRARRSIPARAAPPSRRACPWPGGGPARRSRRARSTRRCRGGRGAPSCALGAGKRFGLAAGEGRAVAAQRAGARNRALAAGRSSRRGPSSPGRSRRRRSAGVIASSELADARLASATGASMPCSRATTRSTLVSITSARRAEGDRGDRRGGIGADAGQLAQLGLGRRESRRAPRPARAQAIRLRARA